MKVVPDARGRGLGIQFTDSAPLVATALALLEDSPQPATVLVRRVLGFRKVQPELAGRLIGELLGSDPRTRVDAQGVWSLANSGEAGISSPSLDTVAFAVVDVETTGRAAGQGGRIVEVGISHVQGGRVNGEFSTLVNPNVPMEPWVSDLTGITDHLLADAPSFHQIADLVLRELEGRVFVAHNATFDWGFVSDEMWRARSLLPQGPRLCTLRLARHLLPELQRRGLGALTRYYGIENSEPHRALADARATAGVLLQLLEEADRQGMRDWEALRRCLAGNGSQQGPRGGEEPC